MQLQQHYQESVAPTLMKEFGYKNKMALPKIDKVVVNIGLKEAAHDKGVLEKAKSQLTEITGQLPKVTRARVSIANFKLREGDPVGLTVTLRGKRMYDFVTKLFTIVLPRVRDFHGVSAKAFDKAGNYTLGMSEQIVFPEIDYSKIDRVRGLEITFVMKMNGDRVKKKFASTQQEARLFESQSAQARYKIARRLLELMGMPFVKAE